MRRITLSCLALPLILLGLTLPAAAQNVSIQLTPQGIPIQIPASGGSFSYNIAGVNSDTIALNFDVWCMVTLPNGNPYGPVLGPVNMTLWPGSSLERSRTQQVPAGAPWGSYSFNAYVGIYPDSIWDSDSFPFDKQAELWVARYNGPGNSYDFPHALAVDAASNVYVTGDSYGSATDKDYATIKYNASGIQLWVARYNGPGNYVDGAYALALDNSGNVYVTGQSWGSGTSYDFATVKYNSSGVQQWVSRYNGTGNGSDRATSIAVDDAGNVYVSGYSTGIGTVYDYTTIKYNSAGGQMWVARYDGPGNSSDMVEGIAIDDSENIYVTGSSVGTGTQTDYATIKYNSAGFQEWVARYNGPASDGDGAYYLAVDRLGNVYVTGASAGIAAGLDYATIMYNAEGQQQWIARYDGPASDWDWAYCLAIYPSGGVVVTGGSLGIGTYTDYATVKYNSIGLEEWVARYDGPGHGGDEASSIAVSAAGEVYVTGSSGFSSSDFATVKYNSVGQQQWAARYNGPGNSSDAAKCLTNDASENVYVAGSSVGIGTYTDYATIKYSGGNIDNWMPVEATVLGQPLPQEFALHQNYPNPFNAETAISYQLSANSYVNLRVYDTAGRLVETLVDGWRAAGTHELTFDASDLAAGIYFARLEAGDYVGVQKLVLIK